MKHCNCIMILQAEWHFHSEIFQRDRLLPWLDYNFSNSVFTKEDITFKRIFVFLWSIPPIWWPKNVTTLLSTTSFNDAWDVVQANGQRQRRHRRCSSPVKNCDFFLKFFPLLSVGASKQTKNYFLLIKVFRQKSCPKFCPICSKEDKKQVIVVKMRYTKQWDQIGRFFNVLG